jgi:hypothetical protein
MWQRTEENRRLFGRRPPRYKKHLAGPLQGLMTCQYCKRVMRYREDTRTKQTVRHGLRTYNTCYYYCHEYLRYDCVAGKRGKGNFIEEHLPNGQFGLLLALLGTWTDAASRFIKEEYAHQERAEHGVDEFMAYEAKRAKLADRRRQVNDMYESTQLIVQSTCPG